LAPLIPYRRGLLYGVVIVAHHREHNLQTIVAHGLNQIYPNQIKKNMSPSRREWWFYDRVSGVLNSQRKLCQKKPNRVETLLQRQL
jgi:hypothetical protein